MANRERHNWKRDELHHLFRCERGGPDCRGCWMIVTDDELANSPFADMLKPANINGVCDTIAAGCPVETA